MSAGVLIAGGGLAAQRCAEALRRGGHERPIRMICAEAHRPYDRPPLSKAVLHDRHAEQDLGFRTGEWYAQREIELVLGVGAAALDIGGRRVTLADGRALGYEQLLIATGSRPRQLPLLQSFANVSTLRTLEDARELRGALVPGARVVVIGAGFIGQEVAAAAIGAGSQTTIIEADKAPLRALLGPRIGGWFTQLHRRHGVTVVSGAQVVGARGDARVKTLILHDGRQVACDHVVVGIGVRADLDWVAGSGLDQRGIAVDVDGRAAAPGVFAAGDAACTYDPRSGRHVAGGHWESAAREGARVARAMLGAQRSAPSVASFWSDLYDTRVQYVGHACGEDDVAVDGDTDAHDFSVTFTRRGTPLAVLLVGRPHQLPAARTLLAA